MERDTNRGGPVNSSEQDEIEICPIRDDADGNPFQVKDGGAFSYYGVYIRNKDGLAEHIADFNNLSEARDEARRHSVRRKEGKVTRIQVVEYGTDGFPVAGGW